ncbi:MAG: ankyrin repeat domain-containing protein [Bombilactobacillus sp.]
MNQHGMSGDTMLHIAAWNGCVEDIEKLILVGADINSIGDLGNTPLHQAILFEKIESVKLLLNYNINANIKNESGETIYEMAKRNGNKEIINLLAKYRK